MLSSLLDPTRTNGGRAADLEFSNTDTHTTTKRKSSIPETDRRCDKSTKRPKPASLCEQCKQDVPQLRAIFQKKDLPSWNAQEEPIISRTWPAGVAIRECELCSLFVSRDMEREQDPRWIDDPVTAKIYQKRFLQSIGEHRFTMLNTDENRGTLQKWDLLDSICLESRLKGLGDEWKSRSVIVPGCKPSKQLQDDQEYAEPSHPSQSYAARIVNPKRFDEDLVTSWIRTCKRVHETKCTVKQTKRSAEAVAAGHSIWLIDCTTRQLCKASFTVPYVALSYVWGPNYDRSGGVWKHGIDAKLPGMLPMTIEDAITATLQMSYHYLWVDFYCIDQRDGTHKASQIAMMDLIYGHSELVIIAAAGDDANHGLPGVGKIQRAPQRLHVVDENLTLVSYVKHPHSAIYRSTWNSRGWTFQEGVLAARRLVFTEEQVYFECNCISVWESLRKPLAQITGSSTKRIIPGARAGFFQSGCAEGHAFNQIGSQKVSLLLSKALPTYLQRCLTYEHDILHAFQGFLERLYPASHFHGLPLMKVNWHLRSEKLHWGILNALSWDHDTETETLAYKGAVRRVGFPSFSWTGWTGKADFKNWSFFDRLMNRSPVFLDLDRAQLISGQVSSLKMKAFTSRIELRVARRRNGRVIYSTRNGTTLAVSRPVQDGPLKKFAGREPQVRVVVNVLFLGSMIPPSGPIFLIFERMKGFIERRGILMRKESSWNKNVEGDLLQPLKEEIVVLR